MFVSCLVLTITLARAFNPSSPFANLRGRYIASISDGDFFASTYVDGRIPPIDSRYQDALTLIPLPFDENHIVSLNVSNSVSSAPEALALSPDSRTAFVVEYSGQRAPGATTRKDLPSGRLLTSIDVSNPKQPKIVDRVEIATAPEAIDVHPKGQWLAIATDSSKSDEVLQLVPVQGAKLGTPVSISLASLGIPSATGLLNASYVEWHPSGRYLAVNLYRQNRIVFLEFTQDATGKVKLIPWGNPVSVGTDPFSGRFTPNGQYYITANWGRDFAATSVEGRLTPKPSTVSVVRLDPQSRNHQVVTTVESDRSSEGIAISPDGTMVATANMRETAFPRTSPRFTREATVSLFRFDPASGQLTKAGDFPFESILPEGITFDATGENLLVATFEYLDSQQPTGGLEIWRVERQPNLRLQYIGRINVPHGAHQVLVALMP